MSASDMRLVGQVTLRARLVVKTGLHIGAGKDQIEIGGIDSPVVKTPAGDPYVPGSSLKGKLRFLLEWAFGKINASGEVWGNQKGELALDDPILRIFGTAAKREQWEGGPTRLLMRDAPISESWRKTELDAGRELTEAKTEVVIDRIAGKAMDRVGARQIERVPPGAEFAFEAAFRIYDPGDGGARDIDCLCWMVQGLDLLQQDALGGSGSRGYGQVAFRDLTLSRAGKADLKLDNLFAGLAFDPTRPNAELREKIAELVG